MEHAWDYFKIDEETFKMIIGKEDDFVVSLMKKKYGKDFDGINVKTTIKKNELDLFNLAEELIKIDLEYVNTLIKRGKKYQNYFNNKIPLNQKIEYIQNISHEEFIKRVKSLNNPKRDVILYAFGIDVQKMSFHALSEYFNCNHEDIIIAIKECLHEIISYVAKEEIKDEKETKKIEVKTKKVVASVLPSMFSTALIKQGYTLDDFKKNTGNFSSDELSTLKRLYGFDFSSSIPYYIVVSPEEKKIVLHILDNLKQYISISSSKEIKEEKTFNLKKYYQNRGYKLNDIDDALNTLNSQEKKLLHLLYDNKYNRLNVSLSTEKLMQISKITYSETEGILGYLISIKNKRNNENLIEDIILYYENMGYQKEDIITCLKSIDKKDLALVYVKYDSEFKIKKSVRITETVKNRIISITTSLKKTLDKLEHKKISLDSLYIKYGFTKEDVKKEIDSLDIKHRSLLSPFINLQTLEITNTFNKTINTYLFGTFISNMYFQRLKNNEDVSNIDISIHIKRSALKRFEASKNAAKKKNIYEVTNLNEYYIQFGFTKEEVIAELKNNIRVSKEFCEYIDFDTLEVVKPLNSSSSSNHFLTKTMLVNLYYQRLIEQKDINEIDIANTFKVAATQKYERYLKRDVEEDPTNLIDLYSSFGYTEKDIRRILKSIDEDKKDFVDEYIVSKTLRIKKPIKEDKYVSYYFYHALVIYMYYLRLVNGEDISDIKICNTDKEKAKRLYLNRSLEKRSGLNDQIKKLDEYYTQFGFTKEDIIRAILALDEMMKKQFDECIDLDTLEVKTNLEDHIEVKQYLLRQLIVDMYYLRMINDEVFSNLDVPKLYIKEAKRKYKNHQNSTNKMSLTSVENLLDYYSFYGFSKDEIIRAINYLDNVRKKELEACINLETLDVIDNLNKYQPLLSFLYTSFAVYLCYLRLVNGEDFDQITTLDFAKKRAIKKYEVYLKAKNKQKKSKSTRIKNTKKYRTMINDLKQYYLSLGYDEKIIIDVLQHNLSEEEIHLLTNSYNEKYEKDDEYNNQFNEIIQTKLLSLIKEKTDSNENVHDENKEEIIAIDEYIKYLKSFDIINEEFIAKSTLSVNEKFYLTLEFVWNKKGLYTLDEMTTYFNMKKDLFRRELLSSVIAAIKISNLNIENDEMLKKLVNVGEHNE